MLAIALVAGAFFSCQKEKSFDDPNLPFTPNIVTTSIQGRVTNEKLEPVQGAAVNVGNSTGVTDANGNFLLSDVIADANATTVHIRKEGYFDGSRTIFSNKESLQFVQVELLPKAVGGSFTASAGGTVNLKNCKLQFVANQVLNSNNTRYNGVVNVAYAQINPDSSNFYRIMPGDLRGITASNTEVGLQSYGMIAVELMGAGGEKLHLDSTKAVTITTTIPTSLLATAPSTIPLWYFNEATGLWKEEGKATRQGTNYVGTVKHFSFWNVDMPFPLVDFTARFQDSTGKPLTNLVIDLDTKRPGMRASAYVGSDGVVTGKIPAAMILEMKILQSGPCRTQVYTKNIGPFSSDTDFGITKLGIPKAPNQAIFKGNVTNCAGTAVASGFVLVDVDGIKYRSSISNGSYSLTVSRCTGNPVTVTLSAFDDATSKYTTKTLTVASGTYNENITACDNTASLPFINLTLNGQLISYSSTTDSISSSVGQNYATIYGSRKTGARENFSINFDTEGAVAGTVKSANFLYSNSSGRYVRGYGNLTITKIDNLVIEANMSGNAQDSIPTDPNRQSPFSLSFRAFNR